MLIKFYTFPESHLVSSKEFDRLKIGFAKEDMELVRKDDSREPDIVMVKGFSHTWEDVKDLKNPVVFYNIGTEFKKNIDIQEANKPLFDLYFQSNATVSISEYCRYITERVFYCKEHPANHRYVIIPAGEANLPDKYPDLTEGMDLKLATTCIPRPVKRVEETERLCKKYGIELVPAYGNVDDFSYYHDCHGYIHLSRKEGMPNTVLEAMSYGLPVITTNYGGAKEAVGEGGIIINNDHQELFDMNDVEPIDDFLFEEAIEKFKQDLPNLRLRVRERVLTELNDRVVAQRFKQVFESICG
jgi:hypothetical protein